MSGSANTSDTKQQISTAKPNAGHAEHVTMLGISKQDILRLGGIWPPVGTIPRTDTVTVCHSALPAICTTKEGSGISVDDLTNMSEEELRKLCDLQNARDRMVWRNSENSLISTKPKQLPKWCANLPLLTEQQKKQRIHELREERRRLFYIEYNSRYSTKLRKIGYELYVLTGCIAYVDAYDT